MSIGDRIKHIRGEEAAGKFAQRFGLHRNTVLNYESGDRIPSADFLETLCEHYELDANWLLTGQGSMRLGQAETEKGAGGGIKPANALVDWEHDEDIRIQELLNQAAEVLTSNTVYRPALAANIKAFHRSIGMENSQQKLAETVQKLAEEVANGAKERKELKNLFEQIEQKQQENEELLKKTGTGH